MVKQEIFNVLHKDLSGIVDNKRLYAIAGVIEAGIRQSWKTKRQEITNEILSKQAEKERKEREAREAKEAKEREEAQKQAEIEALVAEKVGAVKKPSRVMLTDEERAEELTRFLDTKLLDGSLSAAELAQFKDIYGLKAKDRDIEIRIVDFKEALPDEYQSMLVARKMIENEIKAINAGSVHNS